MLHRFAHAILGVVKLAPILPAGEMQIAPPQPATRSFMKVSAAATASDGVLPPVVEAIKNAIRKEHFDD